MSLFSNIDISLLKRYDRPGPRYTSYPTAPLFHKNFTFQDFEEELRQTNPPETREPLSLYFHLPFCDTLCYFCGCNMIVTKDRKKIADYLSVLKKEIDLYSRLLNPQRSVRQLHWGGGTPSHLTPQEILDLGLTLQKTFRFSPDIEASSEIDPRELTFDHIKAFKEAGFNRLSMGVQDFNPQVQQAVNRVQPESITRDAIDWSRQVGIKSLNLDLIYGLPFQTLQSFEETVEKIIQISPDRIAVFNYAHVPWLKKHMNLIRAEDLPTPEVKLRLLKMTIEKLTGAGYEYIGMDHFAKPDDELAIAQKNKTLYRNFQGYSTRAGCDVVALGMSAISQLTNVYAQNAKTLPEYYSAIEGHHPAIHVGYRMTKDDHLRREVIMRLMCHLELDEEKIEKEFNIDFSNYFAPALEKLNEFVDQGLVIRKNKLIQIVGMGVLLMRNIVMVFDAYLEQMMKERPVFSRTV